MNVSGFRLGAVLITLQQCGFSEHTHSARRPKRHLANALKLTYKISSLSQRAFSVLDGIGKTLNKKFDISEIAAPYARNLLIEANPNSLPPQVVTAQRDWLRRADAQTKAIVNLFKGPDAIYDIADTMRRIETGKLKIRVRALEAERALDRMAIMQGVTIQALLAACATNIGVVLYVSSLTLYAQCAFGAAGLLAFKALTGQLKAAKLLKKENSILGA